MLLTDPEDGCYVLNDQRRVGQWASSIIRPASAPSFVLNDRRVGKPAKAWWAAVGFANELNAWR